MFSNNKKAVILAVRHNSRRLPNKALLELSNEKTMTELIVKRLRKASSVSNVIIATTESSYSYLKDLIERLNCDFYIGSEKNVLLRYLETAKKYDIRTIVRATGDNPLVSIKALDLIVDYHEKSNADLSYFEGLPYGSGVEVIDYKALEYSSENAKDDFQKEHITQYIYQNKNMFKIESPKAPLPYYAPSLRVTVDTMEDYDNVSNIFSKFNNDIYVEIDDIIRNLNE